MDYVRSDFGNIRPITAAAYHHLPDIVSDGGLMKSFAGFRQKVMVRWLLQAFVGVDASIFRPVRTIVGTTIERQGLPFNGYKGHQPTPYHSLVDLICQ